MEGFRYISGVTTLEYKQDRCTGCRRCIEVCPHGVFAPCGDRVTLSDMDACMECGACARNCPSSAILVDAGVGCATGLINEWLRERRISRRGKCCS